MPSEKQTVKKKGYDREYRKNNMMSVAFRLSRANDADLIAIYDSIPNKMEWFRSCLKLYKKDEA